MRLLSDFKNEKEAHVFYSFLSKQGIFSTYESFANKETGQRGYRIWVFEEDDLPLALEWLEKFQKNPQDPEFAPKTPLLPAPPPPPPLINPSAEDKGKWKVRLQVRQQPAFSFFLTHFLIALCVFLFFWDQNERSTIRKTEGAIAAEIGLTPLQKKLFFDFPKAYEEVDAVLQNPQIRSKESLRELTPQENAAIQKAESAPYWKGLTLYLIPAKSRQGIQSGPLFEKIRQGELWRLFTPSLLHRDWLHILFNMIWLLILGKQMELRMSRLKMLLFVLIVGVVSNAFQYLMTGPYFLGFSGVVMGMVGFIWVRQKVAPWEGYPLQRVTILFIFFFVLAIAALDIISWLLQLFSVIEIAPAIANTAHIVGGLVGMALGATSFFSRQSKRKST